MSEASLLVDDLVVRFGELEAVGGVSFAVAPVNPLTYEVQGLRQMLVGVRGSGEVWLDFLVVAGFFAAMLAAATRSYPKAIL